MKFVQSAFVLALFTGVLAVPVPQDSSSEITKRLAEVEDTIYSIIREKQEAELDFPSNLNHFEARAQIKDTTCRDNGKTYTQAVISQAVKAENDKARPDTYGNREGNKILFNTSEQLYKARLDSKQSLPLRLILYYPVQCSENLDRYGACCV
jgi:hypothetical protein